ncbi:MAG: GNAT family N-acetyltransferase [Chitinophagales bacterium]|nr:GNAT family N-acetyltransferase [Chitinophagales bacterium]
MEVETNGLTLRRMNYHDIEMTRQHRNNSQVNKFLINKKYISRKQQELWFNSINWNKDYYWIIKFNEKENGLIYIKNWDENLNEAETNIFLFHEEDKGNPQIIRAIWLIAFLCFEIFKIKKLLSKTDSKNISAIEIDNFIGFHQYKSENNLIFSICNKDSFNKNKEKILNKFFRKHNKVCIKNNLNLNSVFEQKLDIFLNKKISIFDIS